MRFSRQLAAIPITLCFAGSTAAMAAASEEAIASIRGELAKAGRLTIQLTEKKTPYGREWGPVENIYRRLRQQPPTLMNEAVDVAIRGGSQEERIAALALYRSAVLMEVRQANPDYEPLLLGLLAEDDMWVRAYSDVVVVTLV